MSYVTCDLCIMANHALFPGIMSQKWAYRPGYTSVFFTNNAFIMK